MTKSKRLIFLQYIVVFLIGLAITVSLGTLYYKDEIFNIGKSKSISPNEPVSTTESVLSKTHSVQNTYEIVQENNQKNNTTIQPGAEDRTKTNNTTTHKNNVSPFGFGPYPEVPSGYPYENPWSTYGLTRYEAVKSELLERVRIKLWNQGNIPEGISWENGKVFPIYPDTIYVSWDYYENDDGIIEKYPGEVISGTLSDEANEMLDNGEIPPDVTVYEYDEAGIDPYQFLEITK